MEQLAIKQGVLVDYVDQLLSGEVTRALRDLQQSRQQYNTLLADHLSLQRQVSDQSKSMTKVCCEASCLLK